MHSFNSNSSGKYSIWPKEPNEVSKTDFLSINSNSEAVIMFPTSIFRKRKVYKIYIGFCVGDIWKTTSDGYAEELVSTDLSIELYSGKANKLLNLSYNVLTENAQKHKWHDEEENIIITASKGKREYDLSVGISGIQQAIDSDNDTILFRLRVQNSSNNVNIYNLYEECAWLKGTTYALEPILNDLIPNDLTIYKNKPQKFSWIYLGDGAEQESYQIEWSSNNGKTWNSQYFVSTEKKHTFASETFPEGIIRWRVKVTNEEGVSSEYFEGKFNSVAQRPSVAIEFPDSVNISNEKEQIFTWNYSGEDLAQKSYEIGWSSDDGKTWNLIEVASSEKYHIFAANSFPTGHLIWRVRATNTADYSSDYAYGEFVAMGQGEAPVIESVSQESIPTITWSATEQEAFEIQIIGQNVDYESGLIPGTDIRSFQPNIMLANGMYEIKIRILNSYGRISDWRGITVVLNAQEPNSNPVLMLKENDLHGVTLCGSGVSGRGFYVRKEKRRRSIIFETTYMITDTAWETRNIAVGDFVPEIENITENNYFVHKQQVEKGDILTLCQGWYISSPNYLYSDRLVVTDLDYIVVDTILFDNLDDIRKYTFKDNGYFFLCATYPKSSNVPLFEIQKILNNDLPESFVDREIIIAEYIDGAPVIDCDLQPGMKYLYALRDYAGGYVDSSEKVYKCDFDGIILHDIENPENMVHIYLNEDEYVRVDNSLSKNTAYKQCCGREFPVKESSIQKAERINVTGFLNMKQFQRAYEMFCLDKIVLLRNENHCCHADICEFKKKKYFDKGYIVEIVFERLDKDEEVKLV